MKRTAFTFMLLVAVLALAIPQSARTPLASYGIALAIVWGLNSGAVVEGSAARL